MMDSAHIDVSLIQQTPFTKNITTTIIKKSDFLPLLEHIRSEIVQNHQVLLVYPLVEQSETINYQSIEEARRFWEKRFENVYVTHGKDKEKEAILETFRDKGSLLLATTVVEVGISLPRLTTVVIVGAERLGLATLHQLRGRVSRTGLEGYCYLYTNTVGNNERLRAFCGCVSGFDIAALDLKFRQSGDLLEGKVQSGKRFAWVDLGEDEEVVSEVKKYLTTF
jgi:ATP-dependent DNA helicase RecG